MSNIALRCLVGAFAVVSITGCDATADRGFCQKTDKGYEICIKEENITCKKNQDNEYYCKASGISISLTGEEKHWSTSKTFTEVVNLFWNTPKVGGKYCVDNKNKFGITCIAAEHFGKINY